MLHITIGKNTFTLAVYNILLMKGFYVRMKKCDLKSIIVDRNLNSHKNKRSK